MTAEYAPTTSQQLVARFFGGLRVEVHSTKELQYVMRFLDRKMPHWHKEKWDYSGAHAHRDLPAVGLTGPDHKGQHIIEGCVTVTYLPVNENTISFADFLTLSRKRGHYKPRTAKEMI